MTIHRAKVGARGRRMKGGKCGIGYLGLYSVGHYYPGSSDWAWVVYLCSFSNPFQG